MAGKSATQPPRAWLGNSRAFSFIDYTITLNMMPDLFTKVSLHKFVVRKRFLVIKPHQNTLSHLFDFFSLKKVCTYVRVRVSVGNQEATRAHSPSQPCSFLRPRTDHELPVVHAVAIDVPWNWP